jgi:hypothetical protein
MPRTNAAAATAAPQLLITREIIDVGLLPAQGSFADTPHRGDGNNPRSKESARAHRARNPGMCARAALARRPRCPSGARAVPRRHRAR